MLARRERWNLTSYWSSCSFVHIFTPTDVAMEQRSIKHIINELQLVLSEKRTALSVLRTGIAIFALPLSVVTVLVATSRYYDVFEILGLFPGVLEAVRLPDH